MEAVLSTGLSCPSCGHDVTHVTDSRPRWLNGANAVYRRRKCDYCGEKFSTIEVQGSVRDNEAFTLAAALLRLPDERREMVEKLVAMLALETA